MIFQKEHFTDLFTSSAIQAAYYLVYNFKFCNNRHFLCRSRRNTRPLLFYVEIMFYMILLLS